MFNLRLLLTVLGVLFMFGPIAVADGWIVEDVKPMQVHAQY